MRNFIRINPPDNDCVIFIDQVAHFSRKGDGCMVVTTDGGQHVFQSITFEQMFKMLITNVAELPS